MQGNQAVDGLASYGPYLLGIVVQVHRTCHHQVHSELSQPCSYDAGIGTVRPSTASFSLSVPALTEPLGEACFRRGRECNRHSVKVLISSLDVNGAAGRLQIGICDSACWASPGAHLKQQIARPYTGQPANSETVYGVIEHHHQSRC